MSTEEGYKDVMMNADFRKRWLEASGWVSPPWFKAFSRCAGRPVRVTECLTLHGVLHKRRTTYHGAPAGSPPPATTPLDLFYGWHGQEMVGERTGGDGVSTQHGNHYDGLYDGQLSPEVATDEQWWNGKLLTSAFGKLGLTGSGQGKRSRSTGPTTTNRRRGAEAKARARTPDTSTSPAKKKPSMRPREPTGPLSTTPLVIDNDLHGLAPMTPTN